MTRRLRQVAPDVWETTHPLRFLFGRVELDHRGTVLRLADGGLVLHSPTPLDDALAAELSELGRVCHVLAPSLMHNLYLAPYAQRYPEARFLSAPGFLEKYPRLRTDGLLGDGEWPTDAIRVMTIAGMPRVNETVLLHVPSRSLIVADLLFNVGRDVPFGTALLTRLTGVYGKPAASRLIRLMIQDRQAFDASLRQLLDWDFDRIVVGHGDIVESGGPRILREAYRLGVRSGAVARVG